MPAAPQTYNDGYVSNPSAVNLTGSFLTTYNNLPAAERPAYLRWHAFYRTRTLAMRASVMRTFHAQKIPDGKIRLAWQGLDVTCASGFTTTGCRNAMWPLSDSEGGRTHRTNFYNWVRGVPPSGWTPLRAAYERVGQYLMTTGVDSPWAHLPGQTRDPEVSCRRSFQLMFTDGGWNGGGPNNERDNVATTLPDGTAYTSRRPYAHDWAGSLADVAFRYWATDLQTGTSFGNDVVPVMRVPGNQTFSGTSVAPYWNPNNNPATWQHLTTFAIAFGEAANITNPQWGGSTTAGTQFAEIVAGTRQWPTAVVPDLWHAAVNSRGGMFLATDQASLDAAFTEVLGEIAAQNVASGGAASSYSVQGDGFRVVRAGFQSSPNLRGTLGGFSLNSSGVLKATPDWEANTTLASVAHGSRVVLTASGPTAGVAFRWTGLSTWQKGELNKPPSGAADSQGTSRVNYLRGDTSSEASNLNPSAPFRWRQGGLLGTIANSEPKVVAAPRAGYTFSGYPAFRTANLTRTSVAYVGANDGMLHGFKTADGMPVLSYVPRGVYPFLSSYADKAHVHRMYVDGPIITADWYNGEAWRTLLIGALGAGGRGFFALDVTNPADFSEANADTIVRFDYTAPPVGHSSLSAFVTESGSSGMMGEIATDLGHIMSDPSRDTFLGRNLQVARMKNGKWALLLGNGVNSVNERAVLYVISLDGSNFKNGKPFLKLVTDETTGTGNGLSTPLPVDMDNDGLVDIVYAGDLLGRMWKFDLSSSDDSTWKVVQVSNANTPLIATGRPITSAPAVAPHPKGGLLVTFGTGRLMTEGDRSASTTEHLYGVWDKPGPLVKAELTDLVSRTLAAETATITGSNIAARVLSSTSTPVDYSEKRGWRIALGLSRERVIYNPIAQGRIAYFSTHIPSVAASACSVQESGGSLLTFDLIDGAQPATAVVDINGDGLFTTDDRISGKDVMGRGVGVGRLMGLFETPPRQGVATPCSGDLIMGASGMICAKKPPGPGRRAWRDMRP